MIYKVGGSNMQHVTSIAFLLLTYANYLSKSSHTVDHRDISVGPETLQVIAKKQVPLTSLTFFILCLIDKHMPVQTIYRLSII
jgi:hypothetical protein